MIPNPWPTGLRYIRRESLPYFAIDIEFSAVRSPIDAIFVKSRRLVIDWHGLVGRGRRLVYVEEVEDTRRLIGVAVGGRKVLDVDFRRAGIVEEGC